MNYNRQIPVHEISQAGILEWVAISFLQGIFLTQGIEPVSPAQAGRFFTTEPPGKPPPSGIGIS